MDEIFTLSFLASVLSGAIRLGTPLLFPTLGEIICERGGVLNLGIEGIMLVGSLAGYMAAFYAGGDAWFGMMVGALAGGAFSLIHAFLTISLKANQVISGVMLVLLGIGITEFIGTATKMSQQILWTWKNNWGFKNFFKDLSIFFEDINLIPLSEFATWLQNVEFFGKAFFQHNVFVYIGWLVVPLVWVFLYKTRMGITITSVGESPETADTLGIRVNRIRYLCVFLGGMFAGLGGAYFPLAWVGNWQSMITAGRGWIAVALVIFAFWKPQRALLAAFLFGGMEALQINLQTKNVPIPSSFMHMLPYLSTIVVLVFLSGGRVLKRIGAPSALGVPYERGGG